MPQHFKNKVNSSLKVLAIGLVSYLIHINTIQGIFLIVIFLSSQNFSKANEMQVGSDSLAKCRC